MISNDTLVSNAEIFNQHHHSQESAYQLLLLLLTWLVDGEAHLLPMATSLLAHFFNCLIQSNDLEGWFCGPQIHCITCRAPVTTRCFGCFLSLMTGATLKCKQFSCDLADEKVKNWGPQNVPPSFTEFETLEGAIKERCRRRPYSMSREQLLLPNKEMHLKCAPSTTVFQVYKRIIKCCRA